MLLCDIGNTSFHFLDGDDDYKESVEEFSVKTMKERVFYISVNQEVNESLKTLDNWINIAPYIDRKNYYESMGIDRVVACEAIEDGVVVDAGSAITVDVVKNGVFEGGFIYAGVNAMSKTYKNISSALEYSFNFELDLDKMPKNSKDAISYGYLKPFCSEVLSYKKEIFLTGGDAEMFSSLFPNAKVEKHLLFNGMKKIIKKANLC
jgi:type III pantothenate kinase